MNKEQAKLIIEKVLEKMVSSNKVPLNAYLLVHSDTLNIHWNLARGKTGEIPADPTQLYHTASIAKAFTAILIAMLVEEGKMDYSDPISEYLSDGVMNGLHVYKGKDYSHEIRIEHLVSNTSGLPDYFEEKTKHGRFMEVLLTEPSRKWTPEETIIWSKEYLTPRFPPGEGIHYSNTGFNLLGLIIERVTSKPYHETLHELIFKRLNMDESYLSHYSEPRISSSLPVANLEAMGKQIQVEQHRSFSSIYAAGQAVSTSEDMLKFMKALVEYRLISQVSLARMMIWRRMWIGTDYGYGLMRVRMFAFLKKYNVWGHLGSTGSYMLYNPAMDIYIIGSFNRAGYTGPSIRFAFQVLRALSKVK